MSCPSLFKGLIVCCMLGGLVYSMPVRAYSGAIGRFAGPEKTGLDESLAVVLWHEILTAIGDQKRTQVLQVINADIPQQGIMGTLSSHADAVRMAQQHKVSMVLWGAVPFSDGPPIIDSSITLVPETAKTMLQLRLNVEGLGDLEVDLQRTRVNFAAVEVPRTHFFTRPLVVRHTAFLRTHPSREAATVAQVETDTVVQAQDMIGTWFRVQRPDVERAYIDSQDVDIPPREVEVTVATAPLYTGPDTGYEKLGQVYGSPQRFPVVDMRYRPGQVLWYGIDVEGKVGWLPADLVRPRFSLPVVYFFAGLHYYLSGHYPDAIRAFTQFLEIPSEEETTPSNRSIAYQLRGLSRLRGTRSASEVQHALEDFSQAIDLTPYDAIVHTLSALTRLSSISALDKPSVLSKAREDINNALAIDARDEQALLLARRFDAMASQANHRIAQLFSPTIAAVSGLTPALSMGKLPAALPSDCIDTSCPSEGEVPTITSTCIRNVRIALINQLRCSEKSLRHEVVALSRGSSLDIPVLHGVKTPTVAAGRGVAFAWLGGTPPYTIELRQGSQPLGGADALPEPQWLERTLEIKQGPSFRLVIRDNSGLKLEKNIVVVDRDNIPGYIASPEPPSHQEAEQQALFTALALEETPQWRLEAYRQLAFTAETDPLAKVAAQVLAVQGAFSPAVRQWLKKSRDEILFKQFGVL